jgi:hypothetical protein
MPDGDFFSNACRTYTAFSNRTVYTARYALPSWRLDDLQHTRTEPLPRLRCRRGSAELRHAEGVFHVLLDRRGNAQEIALGGSDPMRRFSSAARTRRTYTIIPVLGYSRASRRRSDAHGEFVPDLEELAAHHGDQAIEQALNCCRDVPRNQ